MKILAFTDIHGEEKFLSKIVKKSEKADILVCCGDFTFFGQNIKKIVKRLLTMKKPLLVLHGNHETEAEIEEVAGKDVIRIHKKPYSIGNYVFLGHGGGGFSLSDRKLEKKIPLFKKTIKKGNKVILVTHAPPFGTELDLMPWTGHVGCQSINKTIIDIKPNLLICGHLHENFGVHQKMGETFMINPGPEGVIIEL